VEATLPVASGTIDSGWSPLLAEHQAHSISFLAQERFLDDNLAPLDDELLELLVGNDLSETIGLEEM
jgi:hypothetical protein